MNVASRIVIVPIAALATWCTPVPASADPPPTQAITTVAVGPTGQPINGYREAPSNGDVTAVSDCTTPSPSAVANDVYYCSPTAAGAGTCWPSTPGSLLCVDNPWDMRLHRVTYGGPLPPVQPTASPDPFALLLGGGTRCLFRNGGAWGGCVVGAPSWPTLTVHTGAERSMQVPAPWLGSHRTATSPQS